MHKLTNHFRRFFSRLNPSPSFEAIASSQYQTISNLIQATDGPARVLSPVCFLQGSYRQDTAIYSINDIDIVVLCKLWSPGSGSGRPWSRNEIFDTIASPLLNDGRYADKVQYGLRSMCIKIDLQIKVEILPVVFKKGNNDPNIEPFVLFRPEKNSWEDGYAKYHQAHLTSKNQQTEGNFKPGIKVLKHLNAKYSLGAVSFHIECLLYNLPNNIFVGSPPEYIASVLEFVSLLDPEQIYNSEVLTPCRERDIFTRSEWPIENWQSFHAACVTCSEVASAAIQQQSSDSAIRYWQILLGEDYFPASVSS